MLGCFGGASHTMVTTLEGFGAAALVEVVLDVCGERWGGLRVYGSWVSFRVAVFDYKIRSLRNHGEEKER